MISMEYKNKRGNLSNLMSENQKISGNVQILSYDFACRISRLFQYLTEDAEYKEFVMAKQVYRSGTSIGANIREANHAQSKADFLNKMNIALKEADETDYWLNLLHDNGYLNDSNFESINHDCIRILKCLSAIVKSVKRNARMTLSMLLISTLLLIIQNAQVVEYALKPVLQVQLQAVRKNAK